MSERGYAARAFAAKNLRPVVRGDIVRGMARPKLFDSKDGPVLAVTWPFHKLAILVGVEKVLQAAGYETLVQRRDDADCYELIVGAKAEAVGVSRNSLSTRKDN